MGLRYMIVRLTNKAAGRAGDRNTTRRQTPLLYWPTTVCPSSRVGGLTFPKQAPVPVSAQLSPASATRGHRPRTTGEDRA